MTTIYSLPPEILQRIGVELSPNDLLQAMITCKFLRNCFSTNNMNDILFWRQYCKVRYRVLLEDSNLDNLKSRVTPTSWEEFARYLSKLNYNITYHNNTKEFGCPHYSTEAKIMAFCCNNLFMCRYCHDKEIQDHQINR